MAVDACGSLSPLAETYASTRNAMDNHPALRSADDVCLLLQELSQEKKPELLMRGMVRIVTYMRSRSYFSGRSTESIAELETALIAFLNSYSGAGLEELYGMLREIITQVPKFQIFGIDITELREITHDFDATWRDHPAFASIASDIRKLVHQHLSEKVISRIEALQQFLQSKQTSGLIENSIITGATAEDKQGMLDSELFSQLLLLKDKLAIAWSGRQDRMREGDFTGLLEQIMADADSQALHRQPGYAESLAMLPAELDRLKSFDIDDIHIGAIRHGLKHLIFSVILSTSDKKGETALRLITADGLLERISFIYYANIVNAELSAMEAADFPRAIDALYNLALCARAVGHGTKHLGRFAFLITGLRSTMAQLEAHTPSLLEAMHAELENNFSILQTLFTENTPADDRAALVTRILNSIIREKTTHLLGNLINNFRTFFSRQNQEIYSRLLARYAGSGLCRINNFVFRFGTDLTDAADDRTCPEFMGGKGFSQVRNSLLIIKNSLRGLDVPQGAGFSTLTWHAIQKSPDRIAEFRQELKSIITELEARTGKKLGDPAGPLLLMARSGGVISMPGVLDTISHIGLSHGVTANWASQLYEPVRAWQARVSFLLSYAKSVLSIETGSLFRAAGLDRYDSLFSCGAEELEEKCRSLAAIIQQLSGWSGPAIPDDPFEQVFTAAVAVFTSYEHEGVMRQARNYGIPEQFQTACLIQECLPILSGEDCSGVFFTRNPATGNSAGTLHEQIEFGRGFFGNVIADGVVSPEGIENFIAKYPLQYECLRDFKYFDERAQRYPTDIEFAVRSGRIHIVQSRILRQSPAAQIINSYDFYREGIYTPYKLIKRTAYSLNKNILQTYLDRKAAEAAPVIAIGKPVFGGAVRGRIIVDHNTIARFEGPLIFLTESNVPPRVIMNESRFAGYISKEGGVTSHAALIAIGEKKPCVTDVAWERGEGEGEIILGGMLLHEGDHITLDANTGTLYLQDVQVVTTRIADKRFQQVQKQIISVIDRLIAEDAASS